MRGKQLHHRPEKACNSTKCGQKLINPVRPVLCLPTKYNGSRISNFCKTTWTASRAKGKETTGIQRPMAQSLLVLSIPIMRLHAEFALNSISGLRANGEKLLFQPEAVRQLEISGACPKGK